MPICSFFLQNRCRFGDSCKFEHPRGGGSGGGSGNAQRNLFGSGGGGQQRVTFRDSFGTGNNQTGNSNQFKWTAGQQSQGGQGGTTSTSMDLVNGLTKEMDAWEKTKMWPFSCLSVEKELPCLPEFHDISVEEVRVEAYEAQKSGTIPDFNQKLQGLAQQYQGKRNQLRQMSNDLKQKLASFIDDARRKRANLPYATPGSANPLLGSTSAAPSSLFGKSSSPGSTTFGQTGQTNSGGLFGKPAGQSTVFGSSPFGSSNSNGLLSAPQGMGTGIFGSPTPQNGSSIFGGGNQASPQNQTGGLFGNAGQQQQTTSSLFGGGSGAPTGLFGKPTVGQQQNSVFGNFGNSASGPNNNTTTPPTGLFGKPAPSTTPSVFGNPASIPPSGGLFGQNPTATPSGGLFGQTPTGPTVATPSAAGLFGKPAAVSGGLFGGGATQAGQFSTPTGGGGLLPTPGMGGLLPNPVTGATGLFGKGTLPAAAPSSATTTSGSGFGLFGNNNPTNNLVNSAPQGSMFGTASSSIFAMPSTASASLAGVNSKHYSSMDELSTQDLEAFKADTFVLGKIPIKPPPRELIGA